MNFIEHVKSGMEILLKSRVSEIRINQIRVNQRVGVLHNGYDPLL